MRGTAWLVLVTMAGSTAQAATLRVPEDHKSIQEAIAASRSGDTIVVAAGKYRERLRLKAGIVLRSAGDDTSGPRGLRRATATILDGGGKGEATAGVEMAEGCTLDGFTITNVGIFDGSEWKKHFDSKGEDLGDEEGSVQAEGTTPAVRITGVSCTVTHCIVYHNGDVGIGILGKAKTRTAPVITDNIVFRNMGGGIGIAEGATPLVRGNVCLENLRAGIGCRKADPIIVENNCFGNIRAGIGCREGARPVLRGNKCSQNRRAGIGIRMEGTAPVVEGNECNENAMAGIGCRDGAKPLLRKNRCLKNRMAGIGCRDGAEPTIVDNECRENAMAGIGVQGKSRVFLQGNKCLDNALVAIGITDGSTATITDNELARKGGQPPLLAVKDGSIATIRDNRLSGGGVAAILVQGKALIQGNNFQSAQARQGNAVWVWANSTVLIADNSFDGYRCAVHATKSSVLVSGNTIRQFQGTAIVVQDSTKPAQVVNNTAHSQDARAKAVQISGPAGIVEGNAVKMD